MQYEERGSFEASHFAGDAVYEWNIDGKSEHEILSTLHEMVMAATAYKAKDMKGSHIATA